MKVSVTQKEEKVSRKLFLSEFSFYDSERFITFNIVSVDTDKITVAISRDGKISVLTYDLKEDKNGCLFFEYGLCCNKIALDDFEQLEEDCA